MSIFSLQTWGVFLSFHKERGWESFEMGLRWTWINEFKVKPMHTSQKEGD
jgi:hypothetical protein